ncbi:MAG: response regulator [Myxococcota bacterium]
MILVVDDDMFARDIIERTLQHAGYEIASARDGREGIDKASTLTPDLIVLDLMLPEVDGFGVVRELAKHEHTRTIPIIILTALDLEPHHRERLRQPNIVHVLRKSASVRHDLLHAIAEL